MSIAAAVDGVGTVGVVADPTHGRTYQAVRGGPASCDGRPLRLGPPPSVAGALVATGFSYDAERRGRQGEVVARLLPRVRDIRRMGAAAVDLCSVAAGRVDAYFEAGLSAWDLAAGAVIAEAAGRPARRTRRRPGPTGIGARRTPGSVRPPPRPPPGARRSRRVSATVEVTAAALEAER